MANKFWLGGTGNWDGTTGSSAHWGTASGGGTTPTAGPGVNDVAIFDASSGGGTVTVTGNITVQSITCGAFTGTLNFSTNNNNVTLSANAGMSLTGSGVRTVNLGNGTWTLSAAAATWNATTTTNLTFNANSSVISFTGTGSGTFNGGGLTYSTVTFGARSGAGFMTVTGSSTIATLNTTAPNCVQFAAGTTQTITNAPTWTGSSSNQIGIMSSSVSSAALLSSGNNAALTWCALRDIAFQGAGTHAATNSFGLGDNSGITITAPVAAGVPAQLINSQGLVG